MKRLPVTDNCLPIGQFKAQAKKQLARLAETDQTLIITQNGKAAAVLMSPREYDRFYTEALKGSIDRGLADLAAGRTHTHKESLRRMDAQLAARRAADKARAATLRKPSTKAAKTLRSKPR